MADAIAELRREIHKRGFDTKRDSDGHWHVYSPDGNEVRTKKGIPITFASTPSDHRSLNNTVARLRDAKVLPRPTEAKAQRQEVKLTRARLEEYSTALRAELRTLMRDHGLEQTDIYTYGNWYAEQHDLPYPASHQGMVSKFLKGASLGNKGYEYLSRTISAIKAANGDIPRAAQIRTSMTTPAPQPEVTGVEVEGESKARPAQLPDLAFETMQAIYREDKDPDAILDLVQRIARLELDG